VGPIETAKVNGVARYAARNRKDLAERTQAFVYGLLKEQDEVLPDWRVAREFGNQVHQVIENIINGKPLDYLVRDVEGTSSYPVENNFTEWVPRYWDEFVRRHNVRILSCEQSVVSDKWGYAGSYDLFGLVDGEPVFIDAKSNAKGPHLWSVALQNKAYGSADYVLDFITGEQSDLPQATGSRVLWLRPEGWNLWPLPYDNEIWRQFYAHLLLFQAGKSGGGCEDIEPIHADQLIPPPRWGG